METFSPSSMSTTATTNNHHPTTHSSSQARPPAKRTSNTCVTCRARKVRCDGRRDVCANCERLGFSCSYDDGAGLNGEGLAGDGVSPFTLPRRRVRQACLNCHSRKARCSGTTPKCDRCRAQGIECVYRPGKRVRASVASTPGGLMADTVMSEAPHVGGGRDDHFSDHSRSMSSGHPDHASATSPSNFGRETPGADDNNIEAVAMRTFDNFFRYVHHIPMLSFLHRASLMQRYHAGLIDRPLLLAMIGITALLSDLGPGTKELGPKCIDQAEALVLKEIERPSTLRLQALILIIKHRLLSTRFSSAFMLQAIASRFAVALRLNYENPKLCFLAQESRRRLMWSLYMLDTGLSGGLADFSLWAWRSDAIKIQLPCNERNFEYDLPETTEPLQQPAPGADGVLPPLPDDIGFLALHIRVHLLRNRILQYTKAVASRCTPAVLAKVPTRLAELSGELEAFSARLPVSFRWSDANVRLRTYSPRLCVFVMTHIWWQQCHCDLYRVALAGLREAMPSAAIDQLEMQHPGFAAHCRQKVYEHAREMADMFGLLLTLDNGVPVTDMDLPVCLYQCVRMLFYTLQHSSEGLFGVTTEGVVEMAKVCDKVLRQVVVTPITMNIREDMDKLLANGPLNNNMTASRPPTPSAVVMDTPGGHQRAASAQPPPAVLSRHSVLNKVIVEDDASANPGLPSPTPATDFPGGVQAFYQSLETPMPMPAMAPSSYGGFAPTTTTATHHPDPAAGMATGGVSKDGVLSNGTSASQQSNAFEGALEGLDMTLEPFGMESLTWFSNDWLNGDFPQADMSAV